MTRNPLAKQIVDAAYRVHTTLGPDLLMSVYELALAYELEHRQAARDASAPGSPGVSRCPHGSGISGRPPIFGQPTSVWAY
ncbi:MAG TPA: GxxExxY protein [Candidatus Acidoferrales bacterium]|nr:GxxExxY protein [Candidatus Acidoferrales bacterium]